MALTVDVLNANERLATLTPEQKADIATLSATDENTVIGSKIGELHGKYDQDVLAVAGVPKNAGEKSYDYMKRVLGEFKTKAASAGDVQSKITQQEAEIATLKSQIASGKGNETLAQELRDAQGKLTQLQGLYDSDKTKWTEKEGEFTKQITGIQVEAQFEKAVAPLKFKAGYPESVQQTLLASAKSTILSQYKPDWVEENGKKAMVFRDAAGEILRNKANLMAPYTAQELIADQLKEVLDGGRKVEGGGTGKPEGKAGAIEVVDIAGARTQVQADEMIEAYLMQIGEIRGSASFAEKQKQIRLDAGVTKLPIK